MTLYKKIVLMAEKDKASVEKTKELALIEDYNYRQRTYLYAKSIISPKKDITSIKVAKPLEVKGNSINENILKDDYVKLAKRAITLVEDDKNNRFPNFVRYNNYKISPALICYAFAKIIIYINKNGQYPDYCNFNSKIFNKTLAYKKYGHATDHCCDDMGQNNGYFCGCHSLQEVIRNLTGKVIPQSTIASWAGTTNSGTDHEGLNFAVASFNKKYGYNLTVNWKHFSDLGWNGIQKIVNSNNQDCIIHNLYRNQYGHYEVVNNVSSSNIEVQNSLGSTCSSGCYYGYVEDRSPGEFRNYISGISQKSVMIITRE